MFRPFTVLFHSSLLPYRSTRIPPTCHFRQIHPNPSLTTNSLCSSVPYIHRFPSFQRDLVELLDRHGGAKTCAEPARPSLPPLRSPLRYVSFKCPAQLVTSKAGRVRVSFPYPSRNPLSTVSPTQSLSLGGHLSLLPPSHVPTVSCF